MDNCVVILKTTSNDLKLLLLALVWQEVAKEEFVIGGTLVSLIAISYHIVKIYAIHFSGI